MQLFLFRGDDPGRIARLSGPLLIGNPGGVCGHQSLKGTVMVVDTGNRDAMILVVEE